jgi:Arm DNA-binding domain
MTPRQTLSILFYLRRDKLNSNEVVPIYLIITVNGRRSEMSAQRSIAPDKWNKEAGKARGSRSEAKLSNEYIDTLKGKVYQAQKELMDENLPVTALALRNRVQGTDKKQRTLMDLFEDHNKLMESLVPDEYSPTILVWYKTTKQHIQSRSLI